MADENILEYFEREKSVKIPTHIKNLLLFAGFDNKMSLSKFESEDIDELVKIGREIIPHVIDRVLHEKYLGIFATDPRLFSIFSGHRKILIEMSQFYRNFPSKKRHTSDTCDTPTKRNRTDEHRDFEGEKQNIFALLSNWIINFCSRNLTNEESAHVTREMSKMRVEISNEDSNQCFVTCCVCLKDVKIFRNQNGFWIMSNIHKHFKTHLNTISNKKFSKNISLSSTIANHESDSAEISEIKVENDSE